MALRFKIVHLPKHFGSHDSLGDLVREENIDFLSYTNADADHVQDLPPYRAFHVVRDPRDIVVSAYYSHKNSLKAPDWDELTPIKKKLQDAPKKEGLFIEMDFLRWEFEHMRKWDYNQEHILEVKMEELTAAPKEGFSQIMRFLGLLDESAREQRRDMWRSARLKMNRWNHRGRRFMPGRLPLFPFPRKRYSQIPRYALQQILNQNSFARLTGGRRKGQEDVNSHYRKGVPGDWKNHFSTEHIQHFKNKYNDILVKLGYENDSNW